MPTRRILIAALAGVAAPAAAQPSMEPAGPGLFDTGAPTHRITRHAFVSADGARRYRVDMAVPVGPRPRGGWPALWLLDGNAAMVALSARDLSAYPGLAVVGVGYDTPLRFDNVARTLDYTPRVDAPPERPDRPEGGAGAFRDLLLTRIRPALERLGGLDPGRASLWGHSYGGLFVLDTLWSAPGAFRNHLAVSPSLWRYGDLWPPRRPPAPSRSCRLVLMIGDSEARRRTPGPGEQARDPALDAAAAVAAVRALADRLAGVERLSVSVEVLAGQGHGGALTASLPKALAAASVAGRS